MVPLAELLDAIIASLILATGLIAFGAASLRLGSRDRAPIWFGTFLCLYGVRLFSGNDLLHPLMPEVYWRYLAAFVTYVILLPAGLFVESLFGPGWHLTVRRAWQLAAVYAAVAIVHDLVRHTPGSAMWLNVPAVIVCGSVAIAHIVAYNRRERWPREYRVAAAGGLVFLLTAAYQTISGKGDVEPVAMLVFVASLGYLVAQRTFAGERRLVALSKELDLAREIQQSILPRALPQTTGLSVAARYQPMTDVGGDFYDFEMHGAGGLAWIVADVSGHGVPAALVASMVKVAFAAESECLDRPGTALTNINRTLCGRFAGAYVTASCGYVDSHRRTLRYASAGHPSPLLRRQDGRVERLAEGGLLLAFRKEVEYATTEVPLQLGDRVVFYSDGVIEASNGGEELFGMDRLEALLVASSAVPAELFIDQLISAVKRWIGPRTEAQDDVTVVVLDVVE